MEQIVKLKTPKKKTFSQWVKSYSGQKLIISFIFLLIPLTLLTIFTFVPAVNMIVYSFQTRDQFGVSIEWVGLDNYKTLVNDPTYFKTMTNSFYYFGGSIIQICTALLISTILCSKIRFKNFFKSMFFFPYMINVVAVSLIFRRFFQKGDGITNTEGTLNSIIQLFGGDPVIWLGNPKIVNFCLVFASMWRYIGFDIIMFIGAIQSISPEIYEASEIDGANRWQQFRYIIMPGIRPIIALQMILAIKGAISVFEIPFIITKGYFGSSTFVITAVNLMRTKAGLASAMAVILLIIIIIVTTIQKRFFKEVK